MKLSRAALPLILLTGSFTYGCDEPRRTLSPLDAASGLIDVPAAVDLGAPARDAVSPADAADVVDAVSRADAADVVDAVSLADAAADVADVSSPADIIDAPAPADVADAAGAGGRATPSVDGVIGVDWPAGSLVAENATPSPWGPSLNALRALRVAWDDTHLYVGVTGIVEATNALVVFIDRDATATSTGLRAPSSLTDSTGALDDALSCAIDATPTGFGAEIAWGTVGMQRKGSTESRPEIGIRDVACPRCAADLGWIVGDSAACVGGSAPACEVAIPWTSIYGPSGRPPRPTLALFARITNLDGSAVAPEVSLPRDPSPSARAVTVAAIVSPTP
jgi:hypothetical protein